MNFPHGEPVVILTAGTEADPYGDTVEDWDAPTSVTVPGCGIEPRPSNEPVQDARNATISGYTVYLPAGTVIGPQNRLTVRGATYHVEGQAAVWHNPFTGWDAGVVVQVQRTVG